MPTKSYHGVTLWAVPRFHRANILPAKPGVTSESGANWMTRLKTYSFPLGETGESPAQTASGHILDQAELRY